MALDGHVRCKCIREGRAKPHPFPDSLIFDETGQGKKGTATAAAGRQYSGTMGRVENVIVAGLPSSTGPLFESVALGATFVTLIVFESLPVPPSLSVALSDTT